MGLSFGLEQTLSFSFLSMKPSMQGVPDDVIASSYVQTKEDISRSLNKSDLLQKKIPPNPELA